MGVVRGRRPAPRGRRRDAVPSVRSVPRHRRHHPPMVRRPRGHDHREHRESAQRSDRGRGRDVGTGGDRRVPRAVQAVAPRRGGARDLRRQRLPRERPALREPAAAERSTARIRVGLPLPVARGGVTCHHVVRGRGRARAAGPATVPRALCDRAAGRVRDRRAAGARGGLPDGRDLRRPPRVRTCGRRVPPGGSRRLVPRDLAAWRNRRASRPVGHSRRCRETCGPRSARDHGPRGRTVRLGGVGGIVAASDDPR